MKKVLLATRPVVFLGSRQSKHTDKRKTSAINMPFQEKCRGLLGIVRLIRIAGKVSRHSFLAVDKKKRDEDLYYCEREEVIVATIVRKRPRCEKNIRNSLERTPLVEKTANHHRKRSSSFPRYGA